MKLPKDILSGTYTKPRCFLCEPDKTRICPLETTDMHGTFKFNSYSELNFNVAYVYNDVITGEIKVNPFYDKVEAIRLIELDDFGYFELQDPEIEGDGIKEIKSLTAYSLEYTLSQKYLENFYVNKGTVDSVEVLYMEEQGNKTVIPVTLYNSDPRKKQLSLLHLILDKVYGWEIGHVDASLQTMSRQFEVSRESIYDFIMNEICEQFNCYVVFDTIHNTINFYAEEPTVKFFGNGKTNKFTVRPAFEEIGTVSVDGYKTIKYTYVKTTGVLTLEDTPSYGTIIEVTDGSLSTWETDVYVTFDNLAQQMNVSYSADDIKTVLTVKGADDLDIREVNNGLPYIVDLSYFHTVDRMGQELYNAYGIYLDKCNTAQDEYRNNAKLINEISNQISYETNRLSLQYSEASVNDETIGTYYVRGGSSPNYYYAEVSLPADYNVGTIYYSTKTTDLNEEKVAALYEALKTYYHKGSVDDLTGTESTLKDDFSFMKTNTITKLADTLKSTNVSDSKKDEAVLAFFAEMWNQLGLTPLKTLYLAPYKEVQTTNVSAGLAEKNNEEYGLYYPVVLIIKSLEIAIKARQKTINDLIDSRDTYSKLNAEIASDLLIANNFDNAQMVRLSAFLREDEYIDDNFVATGNESVEELLKLKQELLECGRIELSKLCKPRLKFSMSLANIYALPEFAPIVDQFQLGNLIKVALRPDCVKHTRLMQVDLNFEDFSDFSCEFGDLSSIRSQTDLHADLLSQAVSAGKTVASNASYWDKGTDTATAIDIRVQQGLLNAATEIKSIDATQSVVIDNYGIHLQEVDPETGDFLPEQGWIVNNKFLYSDDAFKTTKSVFGKYTIEDQEYWGLLADAVVAGYIEGSTINGSEIIGGTIQIGERNDGSYKYNFEVDKDGYITMVGGKGVSSDGQTIDLDEYNTTVKLVASNTVLSSKVPSITLTCKIYSYGVDVTNKYKNEPIFQWVRLTGDNDADKEWNNARNNEGMSNTLIVTSTDVVDVAFFQCIVTLSSDKSTDPIAITLNNADVHVFTSKPDAVQLDGYCYHAGDMWVVGNDYRPQQKELTYQWYYMNATGHSKFYQSNTTISTYSAIMDATRANRQVYCIAIDADGNSIASNIVTLGMSGVAASTLSIRENIIDQQVLSGETVNVTFDVEGENLTYQWYYMNAGGSVFSASSVADNTYTTTMDSSRAGRQIYCIATDKNGNSIASNIAMLNMIGMENTKSLNIQENVTHTQASDGEIAKVDFYVERYLQNTILVCTVDSASYSDSHWTESVYYSQAFDDLQNRTDKLEQHVIIDTDGLHLRAFSQDDVTFESLLTAKELSFGTWSNNKHNKVVWLGTDDMSARNVTIENYLNIVAKENDQPYINLDGFKFQIEDNGSLSIM